MNSCLIGLSCVCLSRGRQLFLFAVHVVASATLVIASSSAISVLLIKSAAAASPQCYRLGRDGLLGFIDAHGTVVTEPKFQYADHDWIGGSLWVRVSAADRFTGNFIGSDGRELFSQQFGDVDDPMNPDPFFSNGICVVRLTPQRRVYLNQNGAVLFDAPEGWLPPGAAMLPMKHGEQYGYGNRSGAVTIEPQFQDVRAFQNDVAPVCVSGRWGLIDTSGTFILEPSCDAIVPLGSDAQMWACRQSGKWGIARADGTLICPPKFDEIDRCNEWVATIRRGDRWGLATVEGVVLVPPVYQAVRDIGDGVFFAKREGLWGVVRFDGQVIQEFRFTSVDGYPPGMGTCSVSAGPGKEGVINRKGELLFGNLFRNVDDTADGFVLFRNTAGWGVGNACGEILVKPTYEEIKGYESLISDLAIVKAAEGWGLLTLSSNRLVVPCKYTDLNRWNDLFAAEKKGVYTLFGMAGKEIVSAELGITDLPKPHEMIRGYGIVRANSGTGVITRSGVLALPLEYEDAGIPSEDLIPVKRDGQWGYLDKAGAIAIAPRFTKAGSFRDGLAAVEAGGQYGYIDRAGQQVIQPIYADAGYSRHGLLPVARKSQADGVVAVKWGLINRQGKIVLPLDYDCIEWGDLEDGKTRFYGRIGWQQP